RFGRRRETTDARIAFTLANNGPTGRHSAPTVMCERPSVCAAYSITTRTGGHIAERGQMARSSGSRREFVRAAMEAPYLERGEEHDLAVRWREGQDQAALHRLTAAHMRLVIAIAARF